MNTLKILKMTYGARKGKKIFAQIQANQTDQCRNIFGEMYNYCSVSGYFLFSKSQQGSEYWCKVAKAEALTRKRLELAFRTHADI